MMEVDKSKAEELIQKLSSHTLQAADYELLIAFVTTVVSVNEELEKKKISINRLRRLFNIKSEKLEKLFPALGKTGGNGSSKITSAPTKEDPKPKKQKGHGRQGAHAYPNALWVEVKHASRQVGELCPLCVKGKLYKLKKPGVFVRITASTPFTATVYEREKFRCSGCGEVFSAPLPGEAGEGKYEASVGAVIAILKYGLGLPFYRIAMLAANLSFPLAPSTQWDIIEQEINKVFPVYEQLVNLAAGGEVIHNDDTNMKILSLLKENKENRERERKGIFTTGMLVKLEGKSIVLYYTGRNHAGENLTNLLKKRTSSHPPPIQMCDGLASNLAHEYKTLLANCLIHGRRNFVDIVESFPIECEYVIKLLADVYKHEAITKKEKMSPDLRLAFHQKESGPVMETLKWWMETKLKNKEVEPNSPLQAGYRLHAEKMGTSHSILTRSRCSNRQ